MIDWMKAGKKHSEGKEATLITIFNALEWQDFKAGKKEPMMPALGIKGIINQIQRMNRKVNRKPLRYAISHELAPFGLYGIEFDYTDATVKSYWVDDGVVCSCLAAEPTYKTKAEAKP